MFYLILLNLDLFKSSRKFNGTSSIECPSNLSILGPMISFLDNFNGIVRNSIIYEVPSFNPIANTVFINTWIVWLLQLKLYISSPLHFCLITIIILTIWRVLWRSSIYMVCHEPAIFNLNFLDFLPEHFFKNCRMNTCLTVFQFNILFDIYQPVNTSSMCRLIHSLYEVSF